MIRECMCNKCEMYFKASQIVDFMNVCFDCYESEMLWDEIRWKIDEIIDNYEDIPKLNEVIEELTPYYTFDELFCNFDNIEDLLKDWSGEQC